MQYTVDQQRGRDILLSSRYKQIKKLIKAVKNVDLPLASRSWLVKAEADSELLDGLGVRDLGW